MGRRKAGSEMIENPQARLVCFSKRRHGLFQKAADLCMLCDARIAIIVLSPSGRVHAFGHTSVDNVVDHYLNGTIPTQGAVTHDHVMAAHAVKESRVFVNNAKKRKRVESDEWFENIPKNPSLEELEALYEELVCAKQKVVKRMQYLLGSVANSSSGSGVYDGGNSSGHVDIAGGVKEEYTSGMLELEELDIFSEILNSSPLLEDRLIEY